MATDKVSLRLEPELLERLERVSGGRGVGKEGQFSRTLKRALRKGLAAVEREERARRERQGETANA